MSDQPPERPPRARFVAALSVRRNATVGFGIGAALAVAVYAFFVVVPLAVPSVPTRGLSPVLYLLLAFVVAVTTGLLVTTLLTVASAIRLSRDLD